MRCQERWLEALVGKLIHIRANVSFEFSHAKNEFRAGSWHLELDRNDLFYVPRFCTDLFLAKFRQDSCSGRYRPRKKFHQCLAAVSFQPVLI